MTLKHALALSLTLLCALPLQAQIPQDGLAAHWNFSPSDGPQDFAAQFMGDAFSTDTEDPINGDYLRLDGNGDYFNAFDDSFFDELDQGWSASAWFRPDSPPAEPTNADRAFIFETSGGFPISLGLRHRTDDTTTIQVFTEDVNGSFTNIDIPILNTHLTAWNHITITSVSYTHLTLPTIYSV